MFNTVLYWMNEIKWNGFLDIAFMSILIYIVLIWFNKTRAAFILKGILIVLFVYLFARQFKMDMVTIVFEKFFGVIFIAMIIIFQEEIRHFFERIAAWRLDRHFGKKTKKLFSHQETEILVRSLFDLARSRIGALVVLRGKDIIERHLVGGTALDGVLSSVLLKSLFDPHSPGHDGALVIDAGRIVKFSCHLPLSKNLNQIREHGTRHAAALGLAELSDVLCLVVSEENGTVSIAYEGQLKEIAEPQGLMGIIDDFYFKIKPKQNFFAWNDLFKRSFREKVYSTVIASALWFVFVYGTETTYKSFTIPVSIDSVPQDWTIKSIEPEEIRVTFKGIRRSLYFIKNENIKFNPDIKLKNKEQIIRLHSDSFLIPEDANIDNIDPNVIKVTLVQTEKVK